ncbi:hypothetical protein EFK50_03780 [Nocardioides marmoriginsengisoli]|uniref:Uncharacterized protein n=1 Tax=Nocardioides marmoriginsengisoli TaxID=661483 RepID=A0A3N0CNQ3_9ACTN|nr:hypothetical protein EFK50_03780 [Nocardioides marmoriginsengisoli]
MLNLTSASYRLRAENRHCTYPDSDTCGSAPVVISEHGYFTTDPASLDSEQLVEKPPAPGDFDIDMRMGFRQLADGSSYFQSDLTDGTSSCWASDAAPMVEMFSARFRASLEVLRTSAVLSDRPAKSTRSTIRGRTVALAALRVLGVEEYRDEQDLVTEETRKELSARTVPLTLYLNADGSPGGFELSGRDVAASLAPERGIDASTAYVVRAQNADATFTIGDLNRTFSVKRPAEETLLPEDPVDADHCPGSR